MVGSGKRRTLADYLQEEFKISVTRACSVITLVKSVYYYRSIKNDHEVEQQLLRLAGKDRINIIKDCVWKASHGTTNASGGVL